MTRLILILTAVLCFAPTALAQEDGSRGEFFVGYSLQRLDFVEDLDLEDDPATEELKTQHGFNLAATRYFTPRLGLTGDFSAHFKSSEFRNEDVPTVSVHSYNILAGPQARFTNNSRATPFVRALAGAQVNRTAFSETNQFSNGVLGVNFSGTHADFALAFGGGLDVRVSQGVSVRVFQADYIPVFARTREDFLGTGERVGGGTTHNLRFSVGVVFR